MGHLYAYATRVYGSFSLQIMESADIFVGDWASCLCRPLRNAECRKLTKLTFLLIPIGGTCYYEVYRRFESATMLFFPELSRRKSRNAVHSIVRFAAPEFLFLFLNSHNTWNRWRIRVIGCGRSRNAYNSTGKMGFVFSCQKCQRFGECHNHDRFYLSNVFSIVSRTLDGNAQRSNLLVVLKYFNRTKFSSTFKFSVG